MFQNKLAYSLRRPEVQRKRFVVHVGCDIIIINGPTDSGCLRLLGVVRLCANRTVLIYSMTCQPRFMPGVSSVLTSIWTMCSQASRSRPGVVLADVTFIGWPTCNLPRPRTSRVLVLCPPPVASTCLLCRTAYEGFSRSTRLLVKRGTWDYTK